MNTLQNHEHQKTVVNYLKLEISDNRHIVILTDAHGNEYGRGSGASTLASINNFYEKFMAS